MTRNTKAKTSDRKNFGVRLKIIIELIGFSMGLSNKLRESFKLIPSVGSNKPFMFNFRNV